MFHKYVIPYLDHFIGLNTFVNNIFRGVLLTLPSAFTGEDFVVSGSTELAEVSGKRIGGLLYPFGKGCGLLKCQLNDGLKNSLELM